MCRHITQSIVYLLLFVCSIVVRAHNGYGPSEQDWGFVEVRPGAHMFYWLYYTTAVNVANYTDRPLVIWLQGGPGASSAIGNFMEVGVLDASNKPRNTTWVRHANVLFVDSPVGTGYSYVHNNDLLVKNNTQIAHDLVTFVKKFYEKHAEFRAVSLHIFGESYGAKMASEFALALHNANARGVLKCNLKSVSLVSPGISPLDLMYAWPTTLLQFGLIEKRDVHVIRAEVDIANELVQQQNWSLARQQFAKVLLLIRCLTNGIDVFNLFEYVDKNNFINCTIETFIEDYAYRMSDIKEKVQSKMRKEVALALNITHGEKYQVRSKEVFDMLGNEFMGAADHFVRKLLDETSLTVNVMSGQLDLISGPSGTQAWIERMKWHDNTKYLNASRIAIVIDGKIEGYAKRAGKFNNYWVNRAGHFIPADNPTAMYYIFREIMDLDAS